MNSPFFVVASRLPILATALLALCLFPFVSNAGWYWQRPVPQGNTLQKVSFFNQHFGYAVGDYGTMMASTDGGRTWELQFEGVTDNIRDVAVTDSLSVWLAADNGVILHTTNGGSTWVEQNSNTLNGLNAIFFLDNLNGWVCGDVRTIRRTTNGGATWISQNLPGSPDQAGINTITFVTANEGWAVSSAGVVYHTTNGGSNWTSQTTLSAAGFRIKFSSATDGFIVGSGGSIWTTTNSGSTWTARSSGTSRSLNDVCIFSSSDIWAVGDNGVLSHSTNAGVSWMTDSLATYASVNGIAKVQNTLAAVGEYGLIARKESGFSWTFVNSGIHGLITSVSFANSLAGVAVGLYGEILRTADGGGTWIAYENEITRDDFHGSFFNGSGNVWIVGDGGAILHSANAGASWEVQSSDATNILTAVTFVDNYIGWAVGYGGTVLHTTDAGVSWSVQTASTTSDLFAVKFVDSQNGWAVGGSIIHTTNGGVTWSSQTSGTPAILYSVEFLDGQNGFSGGQDGVVLHTTNGGAQWAPSFTSSTSTVRSIAASGSGSVRLAGDNGTLLNSTDMGTSWLADFSLTGNALYCITVLDDTHMWIGGYNESILATAYAGPITSTLVDVRCLLQGPYNNGQLNTALRARGILSAHFPSVNIPANAVDSINIEIRDSVTASNASVRLFQPAWLLKDGSIRKFSDTTKTCVEYSAGAGSFYVIVRQRNHLSVMSSSAQFFDGSTCTTYKFSYSSQSAYGNGAMAAVGPFYALFAGDVNGSGIISAADGNIVFLSTSSGLYSTSDTNLSGDTNADDANLVLTNLNRTSQVP